MSELIDMYIYCERGKEANATRRTEEETVNYMMYSILARAYAREIEARI